MGRPSAASARICAPRARSRALSRSSRPASPQARTAPLHTGVRSRCAPVACALHRSAPCRRPRAARVARSLHHWRSRLRAPRRWLPPLVALCRWPPGIIRRRRACSARCGARCSCRGDARRSSRRTTRQRSECGGREPAARAPTCSGAAPAPARAAAHGAQTRAPPVGVRLQAPCHAALAAPTHAALLGASHCCPPCRSRRALRRRSSLRAMLPPGAACRAAPAAALQHAPVAPRLQAGGAPRAARPQGDGEQRVRASEGATAAGWRLRFQLVLAREGPDGRRGGLGRARVRKRCCAAAGVAAARPTAAKARRARAAAARVPRHMLAAARFAALCSKHATEVATAPLIAARGHALDARCGLECCQGSRRWPNTLQNVTCGAKVHERVSARLLWSAWTASNMDTKDRMCSHADPDSTGCMRAHLLSTTPIDRLRRPREHQGTRCMMTHLGGRFVPAEKVGTQSVSN